jgi:NADH dehydrogenase FAD-containing subunit
LGQKVQRVQLDHKVFKAYRAFKVLLVQRDHRVFKAMLVQAVQQVHKVLQDLKVQLA